MNVWKSNLDANGTTDSLADVAGLISIGGLKDNMIRPNIETCFVNDRDMRENPNQLKHHSSMGSFVSPDAYLKSNPSKSVLAQSNKNLFSEMHDKAPEEEFYRQPSRVECIPESAFAKADLDNVPNEVSSIVSKLVNQIDMLSNMLQLLDQRVASNENQAREALNFFKGLKERT